MCRLLKLTRLAPDIQEQVAAMMTETASEPIDRKSLEWVAEAIDWGEQRERFGEVMADVQKAESGAQAAPEADAGSNARPDARDEPPVAEVAAGAAP